MVTDTYQIGRYRLGVRWSEPDFADRLRAALPSRVTDGSPPPAFSVVVGRAPGRARPKHQLYDPDGSSLDSVSPGRLLVALVRRLDDIERWGTDRPTLRLRADVLVPPKGQTAVLVDRGLRWFLNHEAARSGAPGGGPSTWRRPRSTTTAGEVVIPPALPLETPLAELATEGPTDPILLADPPARLRLGGVIVGADEEAMDRALANGVAMAAAPPATGIDRETAERTLRLLGSMPMRPVDWWNGWLTDALAEFAWSGDVPVLWRRERAGRPRPCAGAQRESALAALPRWRPRLGGHDVGAGDAAGAGRCDLGAPRHPAIHARAGGRPRRALRHAARS